ncbi:unnamed protein product [Hydatigera taeniaeformis]|uniref:Peptidase_M28 domain-containing protein n=1 Tax=Hydatigena taeniaeformis TaxID=6205 RepID=A0A0R3WKG4_HYDTA|nr:unnamed protein product [Hydatigera taeniaeformis]
MKECFQVPIYFAIESDALENMYTELRELSRGTDKSNGPSYRAYVDAPSAHSLQNVELINIEGKLIANQFDVKKPTVILAAHYDAGGAIPSLAYGANSNAAGVVVLLEVARILSQLTNSRNVPKHNIMFLLTGGGKFNYLGSKRWLEMISEDTSGIALFDSIEQVINLEGLGVNEEKNLYFHVSRLPKEGTFSQRLLSSLELASSLHPLSNSTMSSTVEVVHKKINLNQYDLAWEHERFALYRLHTATLSAWSSSTSYQLRNSVLDGGPLWSPRSGWHGYWGPVLPKVIARNARVLSEALVRLTFDTDAAAPFSKDFPIIDPSWSTETSSGALLDLLTLSPRSTQLLSVPSGRPNRKPSKVNTLIYALEQYLRSFLPEVRITRHHFLAKQAASADGNSIVPAKLVQHESGSAVTASTPTLSAAGRDPEIVFYTEVSPQKIIIYRADSAQVGLDVESLRCIEDRSVIKRCTKWRVVYAVEYMGRRLRLDRYDAVHRNSTSDIEPIDPERALWLRQAIESVTVDLAAEMRKRIAAIIQNVSSSDPESLVEETTSALDDLIDFTEDVNLADTFLKIGGIALLKALLAFPSGAYRAQSGMLLSNVVQNHEDAQKVAINENLLNLVLQLLIEDTDPGNMSGLLSGISSLVRGSELSQRRFIQCKGFDRLFELLEKTSRVNEQEKYERFNEKASFFIYCLCQELSDEQLVTLKNFHLSERITQLILRLHLPSEFLVKALVLLLNGRVSTLMHSPSDPISNPSSLVKEPISEDSRKRLLDWLKLAKVQDETLISADARQALTNALL